MLDLNFYGAEIVGCQTGEDALLPSDISRLLRAHGPSCGGLDRLWSRAASPSGSGDDLWQTGLVTVRRDPALFERLPVWHNVFMGRELRHRGWTGRLGRLDVPAMRCESRQQLADLATDIADIDAPVSRLSGGQRRAVELARVFRREPALLVIDEPALALGILAREALVAALQDLRNAGSTVLLLGRDLSDFQAVCDRWLSPGRLGPGQMKGPATLASAGPDRLL